MASNAEPSTWTGTADRSGLCVTGLALSIGSRALMQGFDLRLAPGERACLWGPSGCGKTTLLRALAGLIDADAGRVTLNGQTPRQLGYPRWRRRVTYVAQQPVLLAGTVRRNLLRAFEYRAAEGEFSEPAATAWMGRMGLSACCLEQLADGLSVGEQQRVALVRALLTQPSVLLLDEPTSALDHTTRDAVEALLLERCDQTDLSLLLVTHDTAQAERLGCGELLQLRVPATGREGARHG